MLAGQVVAIFVPWAVFFLVNFAKYSTGCYHFGCVFGHFQNIRKKVSGNQFSKVFSNPLCGDADKELNFPLTYLGNGNLVSKLIRVIFNGP